VRFTPSTAAERSPSWNPWEQRAHIRASAVTACVGGRWVVAASAHPRSGDGGLGVALANAVLDTNIRSIPDPSPGILSENELGPAPCDRPGPVADNLLGGVSDG
jgi:hypothetical protein